MAACLFFAHLLNGTMGRCGAGRFCKQYVYEVQMYSLSGANVFFTGRKRIV